MAKVVGIIQARNSSHRLPYKSVLPLAGKPLLYRYIERVKGAQLLDEVVLATTERKEDDVLVIIANRLNIPVFRGSEDDLVDRIFQCALVHDADWIVRLCADNPLVEPSEVDRIIEYALRSEEKGVMFSNTHNISGNGYPDGLGAEVYRMTDFIRLWIDPQCDREHPHNFFYLADLVKTISCPSEFAGHEKAKLDVDTQEEYDFVSAIFDRFGHGHFHITDYMAIL